MEDPVNWLELKIKEIDNEIEDYNSWIASNKRNIKEKTPGFGDMDYDYDRDELSKRLSEEAVKNYEFVITNILRPTRNNFITMKKMVESSRKLGR